MTPNSSPDEDRLGLFSALEELDEALLYPTGEIPWEAIQNAYIQLLPVCVDAGVWWAYAEPTNDPHVIITDEEDASLGEFWYVEGGEFVYVERTGTVGPQDVWEKRIYEQIVSASSAQVERYNAWREMCLLRA